MQSPIRRMKPGPITQNLDRKVRTFWPGRRPSDPTRSFLHVERNTHRERLSDFESGELGLSDLLWFIFNLCSSSYKDNFCGD